MSTYTPLTLISASFLAFHMTNLYSSVKVSVFRLTLRLNSKPQQNLKAMLNMNFICLLLSCTFLSLWVNQYSAGCTAHTKVLSSLPVFIVFQNISQWNKTQPCNFFFFIRQLLCATANTNFIICIFDFNICLAPDALPSCFGNVWENKGETCKLHLERPCLSNPWPFCCEATVLTTKPTTLPNKIQPCNTLSLIHF